MADQKISELSNAGALDGSESVEVVQGGSNVKTTTQDIADLGGGGGTWGSITGTLSAQADLQTALNAKEDESNSATALVDGATIDLTAIKHTLTTASSRTFTISYTGDDITIEMTLNATSATQTFPAGSLCVSEGFATGDNTCPLAGASGDKYLFAIKNVGGNYRVVAKNFGQ